MPARWPVWKIITAYASMTLLALVAVWVMDRKVQLLPAARPTNSAIEPMSR